jgi:hypothetical protein
VEMAEIIIEAAIIEMIEAINQIETITEEIAGN